MSTVVKQTTDKLRWLASVPCAAENSERKMTRMSLCVVPPSSLTFSFDDIVCTNLRLAKRPQPVRTSVLVLEWTTLQLCLEVESESDEWWQDPAKLGAVQQAHQREFLSSV
jgi:hypothetical protein